jgi:hypothetical protein
MSWHDKIFRYCERGSDAAFWAEPLNAVSNAAFVIAAIVAAVELARSPKREGGSLAEAALVAMVFVIGIGSFLFHTFATRWSAYADTVPIGIFMLAYLVYALRRFAGLAWITVLLCLGAFVASLRIAGSIKCGPGLLSVTEAAQGPCLNGTMGYMPAVLSLAGVAAVLAILRHPAWRALALAAAIFLVSMTLRTVDLEICSLTEIAGRRLGTHFLWHTLNGLMLYVLLYAAIRHGARPEAAGARSKLA